MKEIHQNKIRKKHAVPPADPPEPDCSITIPDIFLFLIGLACLLILLANYTAD